MPHNFEDKLAEGKKYEQVLDRFFRREYAVTPVNDFMQRSGNDRIFRPLDAGEAFGVEYKADSRADQTNNAFIETQSVEGQKMGWALTAKAHALVYFVPPRCRAYWVPLARIRAKLEDWKSRYPVKRAPNSDYDTLGVIVPLRELEMIAERDLFIPPNGDMDGDADGRLEIQGRGGGWETPTWATGMGNPLTWEALCIRLEIARRLSPFLRWRIKSEAAW